MNRTPMTHPVTQEELPELQAKRAAAIKAAGTKWLLHPANHVKRKTPMPTGRRLAVALLLLLALGGVGNDCDGHCSPTTEVSK